MCKIAVGKRELIDISIKTFAGETAKDLAQQKGRQTIVDLITEVRI